MVVRRTLLLSTVSALAGLTGLSQVNAQCVLVPTGADDTLTCSSGTHVGDFDNPDGNNTLIFPESGTGTVDGNVTTGGGTDTIEMHSGTITGNVHQGAGSDTFIISDGTVLGDVNQGGGVNTFIMTGGQIGSLNQGGGFDFAEMHGGHIVGLFFAGDHFIMTGGRIGDVNLEQADNVMLMSGGSIDQNVRAAQHNDTLELSGGIITGFVSLGNGNDTVVVTGGEIGGEVLLFNETSPNVHLHGNNMVEVSGGTIGGGIRTGQGSDSFTWDGGGFIGDSVLLGAGNDTATLRNLTEEILSSVPVIDGGTGTDINTGLQTDQLVLDNTSSTNASRYINWEEIFLINGSAFTLDDDFVLGDTGTGTGSFEIDASSTLFAGDGAHAAVTPFSAGQLVDFTNAGTIDLTNGAPSATDTFTVVGNYIGNGGGLLLDTVLGDDSSPSDKLVISQGTASGATGIGITNFGGPGAQTAQNGILVVEAIDGATTAANAFHLAQPVAAGAYEYLLFHGGVTGSTEDNWYLRSTLVTPNASPVPLYRPEVPVYSAVPPVAHQLALATLGTFHERQGEQGLLHNEGPISTGWGRVFGQSRKQSWSGTVDPSFGGTLVGLQTGLDVLARQTETGHRDHAGLFVGHARIDGDVKGFALGSHNLGTGDVKLNGTSLGAYWTHIGPEEWYLDAVLMGTWFDGVARSTRGIGSDIDGTGITASLEAGYPIAVNESWTLEPQAQLIWQHLSLQDQQDAFSSISFGTGSNWVGRIGARLQGNFETERGMFQPYLKANIWHNFKATDTVRFGNDAITTNLQSTSLELGGGIVHAFTENISAFATADYTFNLQGDRAFEGNIGLRVKW